MFKRLFSRRRSEPRRDCDVATRIRQGEGEDIPVRIISLSSRGFRLRGSATLREGAQLAIELPGYGVVSGRVVWTDGDECGGILQNPLAIDDIALTETAA